jgi:glycosyltransferase involved in cell wall biosynthesis
MRILFIISGLDIGGTERRMSLLLKSISSDTHMKTQLLVLSENIHTGFIEDSRFRCDIIDKSELGFPRLLFKVNEYISKYQPDLVHTWDGLSAFIVALIKPFMKFSFVNSQIASAPTKIKILGKLWLMTRVSFAMSDVIVSNSKAGLESYLAPLEKSTQIYNGFDLMRLNKKSNNTKIPLSHKTKGKLIIAMVANFTAYKDQQTLIKAGLKLINKRNNLLFMFVGDGPTLDYCKQLTANNSDNFVYLGHSTDVDLFLEQIDIGVLSTFTEGISNTIMEYMAFAKAVVVTDNPGTRELVIDGENGFFVKKQDETELAEKLELLIDNPPLRLAMGEKGGKRILKKFSLPIMINKFKSIYNTLSL